MWSAAASEARRRFDLCLNPSPKPAQTKAASRKFSRLPPHSTPKSSPKPILETTPFAKVALLSRLRVPTLQSCPDGSGGYFVDVQGSPNRGIKAGTALRVTEAGAS